MNQEALQDVRVAAQMGAPHPARVVEMRKRAFDPFAALAHQAAAASPPHPATIAITGADPRDPSTNHVAPCPGRTRRTGYPRRPGRSGDAVIPLITDDLFQRLPIVVGLRVFDLLVRGDGGLDDRRGVADIGTLQCHATIAPVSMSTACSALCARCVRPSFIFVTFASGSWGCSSSLCSRSSSSASDPVAPDPRAWASRPPRPSRDPPETLGRSRRCPGGRCCASPRSPRASWRQSDGLTRQPAGLDESLLHPRKDGPVRLQIDQAPRARNRRMIGWRLVHGQPQKAADRQRGRRATPSRVPSRCLRSSRPAAGGSSARVPSSVGPSRARRTGHTGLRRTDRSGARRAASSAARRTDGPARWAGPTSRSTAAVDPSRAFP